MESKKPWQSKTIWLGLIGAVAPFFPGVDAWIKGNEILYVQGISLVFMALRLISKGKISIE